MRLRPARVSKHMPATASAEGGAGMVAPGSDGLRWRPGVGRGVPGREAVLITDDGAEVLSPARFWARLAVVVATQANQRWPLRG